MVAEETTGLISTIQSYSIKDGPGIRSTVFCVGCNLRCAWCCNPELMLPGVKTMRFTLNGQPQEEPVGYRISAEDLAAKLVRDKPFYDASHGGVTFSGGEPALQSGWVLHTAQLLRAQNIETALDTAGNVPENVMQDLASGIDLFLYDLKAYDPILHERCTGSANGRILDNLRLLARLQKRIIIRLVIVPGYNDDLDDVAARLDLIRSLGSAVERVDVLPYHVLGVGKYGRLGLPYPLPKDLKVTAEYLEQLQKLAAARNVSVQIEGFH